MRAFRLTLCLLLLAGCHQQKSIAHPPAQEPLEAARNAIQILQNIVNDQNYKTLGFESAGEVKEAQLGAPMDLYNLGIDKLKNYRPGMDAESLLTPSSESIYPITVNGALRSGVAIVHLPQGYEPASFGNAETVRRLAENRQSPGDFAVRVPAFNLYFLGRREGGHISLIPIASDPRLKAEAGQALPIETVIDRLRPYINGYNESPI